MVLAGEHPSPFSHTRARTHSRQEANTGSGSDEPMYDDDEYDDYYEPEQGGAPAEEEENGNQAGEEDDVIVSGDPSAAANALKDKSTRDKKIPESERTTTPYMTKYERARILGTRALQIRYVQRRWGRGKSENGMEERENLR